MINKEERRKEKKGGNKNRIKLSISLKDGKIFPFTSGSSSKNFNIGKGSVFYNKENRNGNRKNYSKFSS